MKYAIYAILAIALIGCADKPKKSFEFDRTCIEGNLYYRSWSSTSDTLAGPLLDKDGKPLPCPRRQDLRPLPQIQPKPKAGK